MEPTAHYELKLNPQVNSFGPKSALEETLHFLFVVSAMLVLVTDIYMHNFKQEAEICYTYTTKVMSI